MASPVPAFDCLSRTWARPTLERAEVPFIRSSPGSGTLDFAAEWGVLLRSSQLGSGLLLSDAAAAPVTRRGTMTTVTDEGLLDHLTTDVLAEQQQFVKARSASSPDKRHPAPTPRAGIGAGEAETVLRTDDNGRVVEVSGVLVAPPELCRSFLCRAAGSRCHNELGAACCAGASATRWARTTVVGGCAARDLLRSYREVEEMRGRYSRIGRAAVGST